MKTIFRLSAGGKRKKLRTEDAKAIWRCFGIQNALILSAASGFRRSTVYQYIQLQGQVPEAWRLPIRSSRWSREQIAANVKKSEQNPTLTLPQLLDASITEGFLQISLTTLHRNLDHEVITYEQLTSRNQQRNAPENSEAKEE
jgi:predicted DNA-binding transcriptional regulator AlpA